MLCLVRISVPSEFQGLIAWIESHHAALKPARGGTNPDGSISLELTAELRHPEEGGAFAQDLLMAAADQTGYTGKLPATVELWPLEMVPVRAGEPDPILLTLNIPFCIHLQNSIYPVALNGQVFQVRTEKGWRNSTNGSSDDSVSDEPTRFETGHMISPPIGAGAITSGHTGTNIEIKDDPHGRYRFSRLTIRLDQLEEADRNDVPKLAERVLPIVNRFVNVYRYITGRAYLPPIQINDIEYVEVYRPQTGEGQYVFLFGRGYENALINEPRAVHDRVRAMLLTEDLVPLHADLVLNARRLLAQGIWRQAVIECIVALEVLVDRLLRRHLVERQGLSESDFEAFLDKEGRSLSDRMKKPLRRAINWSPATNPKLWARWLAVNEVRRHIVHQGSGASLDQAIEAIAATSDLIALIEEAEASLGKATTE
jgi:hypothetical protein